MSFWESVGETRESKDFLSFLRDKNEDFLEGFLLNPWLETGGEFRGGRVDVAIERCA